MNKTPKTQRKLPKNANKFVLVSFCQSMHGENTFIYMYPDTRTHPYTYWTIIWSTLGLEGSAPRGYSCFTVGRVTLPAPSPRPSPRERPHVKPTYTGTLSSQQLPVQLARYPGSTRGIRSPQKQTHTHYTSCKKVQQLVAVKLKPAHRKWEKVLQQLFHSAVRKTVNSDEEGWVSNTSSLFW